MHAGWRGCNAAAVVAVAQLEHAVGRQRQSHQSCNYCNVGVNTLHARARAGPAVQSLMARDGRAVAEAVVGAAAEILAEEAAAGVIGAAEQGNSTHPGAQLLSNNQCQLLWVCIGQTLQRQALRPNQAAATPAVVC